MRIISTPRTSFLPFAYLKYSFLLKNHSEGGSSRFKFLSKDLAQRTKLMHALQLFQAQCLSPVLKNVPQGVRVQQLSLYDPFNILEKITDISQLLGVPFVK